MKPYPTMRTMCRAKTMHSAAQAMDREAQRIAHMPEHLPSMDEDEGSDHAIKAMIAELNLLFGLLVPQNNVQIPNNNRKNVHVHNNNNEPPEFCIPQEKEGNNPIIAQLTTISQDQKITISMQYTNRAHQQPGLVFPISERNLVGVSRTSISARIIILPLIARNTA